MTAQGGKRNPALPRLPWSEVPPRLNRDGGYRTELAPEMIGQIENWPHTTATPGDAVRPSPPSGPVPQSPGSRLENTSTRTAAFAKTDPGLLVKMEPTEQRRASHAREPVSCSRTPRDVGGV